MDAFVAILRGMSETPLTKDALIAAQNSVVDVRYRQDGWRTDQVYVGETLAPGVEKVHYVAPRPDAIGQLMDGFLQCLNSGWQLVEAILLSWLRFLASHLSFFTRLMTETGVSIDFCSMRFLRRPDLRRMD